MVFFNTGTIGQTPQLFGLFDKNFKIVNDL
jgi:hypothetical protein